MIYLLDTNACISYLNNPRQYAINWNRYGIRLRKIYLLLRNI